MFKRLRRLWELWKKSLFDSYESKPTVYKIGKKRFVKVRRFRTTSESKKPYLK
jgi:hypothetical protein